MLALTIKSAPLVALVAGVLTFIRLVNNTGVSFSYDFVNYQYYLTSLARMQWSVILSDIPSSFPYVYISGGGTFEIGFSLISKALLNYLPPAETYALIAAVSVGVRCLVMRRFGLGWIWILLLQIYSITLFEANALRAGTALTAVLLTLLYLKRGQQVIALLTMLFAMSLHLQSLLFLFHFSSQNAFQKIYFNVVGLHLPHCVQRY